MAGNPKKHMILKQRQTLDIWVANPNLKMDEIAALSGISDKMTCPPILVPVSELVEI